MLMTEKLELKVMRRIKKGRQKYYWQMTVIKDLQKLRPQQIIRGDRDKI